MFLLLLSHTYIRIYILYVYTLAFLNYCLTWPSQKGRFILDNSEHFQLYTDPPQTRNLVWSDSVYKSDWSRNLAWVENSRLKWFCSIFTKTFNNILIQSLYEFTGSGWGLWFSSRKWMLYKLGTQENLAIDIKPFWGILEKWQLTRSAFSTLCIAFFLRKTSPYLNCIVLKLRYQKFLKQLPGNGSLFLEPNIQPIELFDFFDRFQACLNKTKWPTSASPENQGPPENLWMYSQMLKVCFWILGT